jgi:hypothetical protein
MSSLVQLTGGGFQDPEGSLLVDGYLLMTLSQDANVGGVNICSGIEIKIQLDASANAVAGQFVWGNDVLLPVNTFYRVIGYTAQGQPAWGPNNQTIQGSTSFDLGTWIPNQVVAWVPPTATVLFSATVAALGTSGMEGQIAYATNGRKVGQGSGAGTGVPVYFSTGFWRVYSTDAQVLS